MDRGFVSLALAVLAVFGCGDNIKPVADAGARPDAADAGQVGFPEDPRDYLPGLGAYVASMSIPDVPMGTGIPTCCRDFGELVSKNEGIDNGYAKFIEVFDDLIGLSFFDVQEAIDAQLDDGTLVWLMDHRNMEVEGDDVLSSQFTLALLFGEFEGATTVVDAQSGQGTFSIRTRSFVDDTGVPESVFEGTFYNEPVSTLFSRVEPRIVVPFVLDGGELGVPLREARLSGMASANLEGVEYASGELSGYVLQDDLFTAFNQTLADRCTCIADDLPVFSKSGDTWSESCPSSMDVDSCSDPICGSLAGGPADGGGCGSWTLLVANQLDIDHDGDGEFDDAVSFGIEFTAARAEIRPTLR